MGTDDDWINSLTTGEIEKTTPERDYAISPPRELGLTTSPPYHRTLHFWEPPKEKKKPPKPPVGCVEAVKGIGNGLKTISHWWSKLD